MPVCYDYGTISQIALTIIGTCSNEADVPNIREMAYFIPQPLAGVYFHNVEIKFV